MRDNDNDQNETQNGTKLKYKCAYIESVLCFLTNRHISKMQRKILLHDDVRQAQIHIQTKKSQYVSMKYNKKKWLHNQIRNRPIEIRYEMNNVLFGVLLMTWILYTCMYIYIYLNIYWSVAVRLARTYNDTKKIEEQKKNREKKLHNGYCVQCIHSTLNDFYTLRSI